jgi:hypothetical protein
VAVTCVYCAEKVILTFIRVDVFNLKPMRIKRYISFIHVYAVIFSFTFSAQFYASAAPAQDTFSFNFENCSISEALKEISNKSGIKITLKSDISKTILSKSYTNRKLDKIITDLLRGENCAVVWNYNRGNLLSIGLYTFDKDNKVGSSRSFTEITPVPVPENENVSNSESLPIVHDVDNTRADEEREIAERYMIAREMERNEGTDNSLPDPNFPGRNRPLRRINEAGNADAAPGITNDSGTVNPGTGEATESGTGGEANAVTPEAPPGVPDEITTPPLPEAPDPHNFNGLEPPPMPPGL